MQGIVYLPRPSRLYDYARSRLRSIDIDPEIIREVLHQYDLELTGALRNAPIGRRSHNVIVNTSAGRKVLKRYRSKWQIPTIVYGHSILLHLAQLGFPAPRLVETTRAESFVNHDGQNYALFDFVEGTSYATSFLPRRHYLRLITIAGRTLAQLHKQLEQFVPRGDHHLGFEAYTTPQRRDAVWQTDRLSELKEKSRDLTRPQDKVDADWLVQKSDYLIDELNRLDEMLREAPLPRTIIHGDFGLHNLIFQKNGAAIPVDFELARLEWRLSDIVILFSRLDYSDLQPFMVAYQTVYPLSAGEWQLLPYVWRFRKIQTVMQYWNSYFEFSSRKQGLASVRDAAAQVDWALDHHQELLKLSDLHTT